ncbi:hypothetical protein N7468_010088 [Penicillium chermesinum]|uniref:Uncharacterized protein n=1 Tax=Penicillium chermesinum TaxID=63820 RepID=A0A9W9NBZ6_9EURO|nr:uncharacterized protein N7468_010088 [Penicillium chermesinum]KAJ5217080.1 hypothetical protein N7468_010088 [Penicillium chermesinum]
MSDSDCLFIREISDDAIENALTEGLEDRWVEDDSRANVPALQHSSSPMVHPVTVQDPERPRSPPAVPSNRRTTPDPQTLELAPTSTYLLPRVQEIPAVNEPLPRNYTASPTRTINIHRLKAPAGLPITQGNRDTTQPNNADEPQRPTAFLFSGREKVISRRRSLRDVESLESRIAKLLSN